MLETPIFDLPYPESTDAPDGAAQIKGAVEKLEEVLAQIEGLLLGEPKAGELLVVNGTNDPVYKAVTGDVTFNSSGVATIGAGKVLEAMLGNESVTTAKIKALAVTAAKLADKAVETAKLNDLAVTEAKLADLAVAVGKLANNAVETAKIKDSAVQTAKLALEAVTSSKIALKAVTSEKAALTCGEVRLTEPLPLGAEWATAAGSTKNITVNTTGILLVSASFLLISSAAAAGAAEAGIRLDEDEPTEVATFRWAKWAEAIPPSASVGQVYAFPVGAGVRTLRVRARSKGGGASTLEDGGYTYLLLASA